MDLNNAQMTYFINQVGLAAKSFGVADSDVTKVGDALTGLFNLRCAPATAVIKAQGPQLQTMCIAEDCKLSPNATCSSYDAAVEPGVANSTLAMGLGNSSSTATMSAPSGGASETAMSSGSMASGTSTPSASPSAGAAAANAAGVLAAGGMAAVAFLL